MRNSDFYITGSKSQDFFVLFCFFFLSFKEKKLCKFEIVSLFLSREGDTLATASSRSQHPELGNLMRPWAGDSLGTSPGEGWASEWLISW